MFFLLLPTLRTLFPFSTSDNLVAMTSNEMHLSLTCLPNAFGMLMLCVCVCMCMCKCMQGVALWDENMHKKLSIHHNSHCEVELAFTDALWCYERHRYKNKAHSRVIVRIHTLNVVFKLQKHTCYLFVLHIR